MLEELMVLNHWVESKDVGFLRKNNIDESWFFATREMVQWINGFVAKTGALPSSTALACEFPDDFKLYDTLDPIDYLTNKLKEQKAYTEYRPLLLKNAKLVEEGGTLEAIWDMKSSIDSMLRTYSTKMTRYDWVKNALERYEKYMHTHGGAEIGITSGLKGLDELTGGWKEDDLILVSGRLGEGKSLVSGYFAYNAWKYVQRAKVNAPVIIITTEMPELEVSYRLDTLEKHFSNRALTRGQLANVESYKEYLSELEKKDSSLLILSQEANGGKPFTPTDIRSIIESEKPALLCIDQLYDLSDGTGERDIRKRIVNVSNGIRDINLYTKTPTILVAQAGRDAAKRAKKDSEATPELFEIQESDAPAQKSTRVITLRLLNDNMFKLTLKKNRGGPSEKDIYINVNIDTGMWDEVIQDESVF